MPSLPARVAALEAQVTFLQLAVADLAAKAHTHIARAPAIQRDRFRLPGWP